MSADRFYRTWAVTTRQRGSQFARDRKIRQVGFREGRNVGGPSRSDTGRHDPSNKTPPDKPEVSSREYLVKYGRWASERVEMSPDRVDRTLTTAIQR